MCQFFGTWVDGIKYVELVIKILQIQKFNSKPCTELIKSLNSIVKITTKKYQASCFLQYIILNAMKADHFSRQEKPFLPILLKLSDFFFLDLHWMSQNISHLTVQNFVCGFLLKLINFYDDWRFLFVFRLLLLLPFFKPIQGRN